MSSYRVERGVRYRATIKLGFFDGMASNATIVGKLEAAGFVQVKVWGEGRTRYAEGVWAGPPTTADLPSQIAHVEAIP